MDEFETINLDTKECKICGQQTEEELISCILREKFPRSGGNTTENESLKVNEATFAHRICLERWDTIMKNTFYPQPKKTWKDRLKGFISAGEASIETWTPVTACHSTDTSNDRNRTMSTTTTTKSFSTASNCSVFSKSKEAYRVAEVRSKQGQWRTSKVRICSVDSEQEQQRSASPIASEQSKSIWHTTSTLFQCDLNELKEALEDLKRRINEVSSDLVMQLEEKDSLLQQKHTMETTVGQLISLQSNVKTASSQNASKSMNPTHNQHSTLSCK